MILYDSTVYQALIEYAADLTKRNADSMAVLERSVQKAEASVPHAFTVHPSQLDTEEGAVDKVCCGDKNSYSLYFLYHVFSMSCICN